MKLRKDLAHWPGGPVGEGHKPGDDIFVLSQQRPGLPGVLH